MLNQRQRSRISPSHSTADRIRIKFTNLVSCHDEMKIAHQSLKSQIETGLNQMEEAFASLAIPLMKLVGLKTVEMAEEGRFSTIIINTAWPQGSSGNDVASESAVGNYATKATTAGRELMEKQQSQFIKLINLLRQIETHVNSRQDVMQHTLARHRTSLQRLFQQVINGLTNLHNQKRDTFSISVKVLGALFDHMSFVFGSVEKGVDELMQDLAEHMCNPMVEYVKGLKTDMKQGTCARLLAYVGEMDRVMRNGRLELEEAEKRVKFAEEGKVEALCKLKEIDAKVWRMNEYLRLLPEAKKGQREILVRHKRLGMEGDQDIDDKLLWELLKKKRAYKTQESPMGPRELLKMEPRIKRHRPMREITRPSIGAFSPVAQRSLRDELIGPQTPCKTIGIPLGSSPSAANAIQEAVSRKRINR